MPEHWYLDNSGETETTSWDSVIRFELNWRVIVAGIMGVGVLLGWWLPFCNHDRAHRYPRLNSQHALEPTVVAGEYYQGDGLGINLSLSILTDGRYSLISSGCTGVHHRES